MALADIWRTIAIHGMAGGAGVALWFATRTTDSARTHGDAVTPSAVRERSVESQRRGRNLAEDAVEAHGQEAEKPPWVDRSPRQKAEDALARRGEMIAERQANALGLVAAAGAFAKDERLLEKIEEFLFTGGNEDDAAAMMLAFILQDEERALEEMGRREAFLDKVMEFRVLIGLEATMLERWAAREDLPRRLRDRALNDLAERLGPVSDLDGLARVWQQQAGDAELREVFIDAFVRQWICDDGSEAVGIIFDKWPGELRVAFLGNLDGFRDRARPIWTDTLAAAMREAPWDLVPEEVANEVLGEIKRADDSWDYPPAGWPASSGVLSQGLEGSEARQRIHRMVDGLLDQGPDLREQLADGRIDVDGLARRMAARLKGSEHYPAEFADVIFEATAGTDPVGALGYARGKIAPDRLAVLGGEVSEQVETDEWRLDRMLTTASLLTGVKRKADDEGSSGSGDVAGDFAAWYALAPEQAADALRALPAKHPLRIMIETRLGKEGAR